MCIAQDHIAQAVAHAVNIGGAGQREVFHIAADQRAASHQDGTVQRNRITAVYTVSEPAAASSVMVLPFADT